MRLKLKKVLLDLKDQPIFQEGKELLLNELLATALCGTAKENIPKLFSWGIDLFKTGEITVDQTDLDLIKSIVEKADNFGVVVKGRLLLEFKAAEKEEEEKPKSALKKVKTEEL